MSTEQPITISSDFDAGNGKLAKLSPDHVEVLIEDDVHSMLEDRTFKQWYYFRANFVKTGRETRFSVINAGNCAFPEAWPGYDTCASYDRKYWFRIPSTYKDGVLSWTINCQYDQIYFSYFAPYSLERHADLVSKCLVSPGVEVRSLGKTLDGRDVDMVKMGNGPKVIWVIARQHPGESMAEWFMEGFLNRLIDEHDSVARKIRTEATLYIVPNINPDGSFRGHLRTNAFGANLNREWTSTGSYEAPTLERSPEVYYVLNEAIKTGCDFFLDVHGDEEIPHNFVTSMAGNPKWSTRLERLQNMFMDYWTAADPDFQRTHGYECAPPGQANLALASEHMCNRFDCVSFTLEMPFKDANNHPMPSVGWSPQRAIALGGSSLNPILHVLPHLRD